VNQKAHLLIIGCGDVAVRALPALTQDWSVTAVMRSAPPEALRQRFAADAVQWLQADLDDPLSLQRALRGLPLQAEALLHSAPPPAAAAPMHDQGSPTSEDSRTRHLLQVLTSAVNAVAKTGHNHGDKTASTLPRHLVYISTSGVYGDCAGALVDESHALQPTTARALRRVDAEQISEVILALTPSVEGDTTSLYLARLLKPFTMVSRIAYGLPVGSELEYADEVTLARAFEGRRAVE